MKTAAVYLRVSTDRQDETNQEPACLRICEQRGWEPVIFREVESGAKARPQWDRVMEAARRGDVAAVVVFSISRIGRRRTQIAGDLASLLTSYRTVVVSASDTWLDTDTSPQKAQLRDLMIQLFGWFAEQEREETIQRTHAGLARVKANLAKYGQHLSSSGRVITKLGRTAYPAKWKQRGIELAATGLGLAKVSQQIHAEGGPVINRRTIRDWVLAAAAADDPEPPPRLDMARAFPVPAEGAR